MQTPRQSILKHSRREAVVALLLWLSALTYTVGYCTLHGYQAGEGELRFVFGIPAWVVWGIFAPWTVSLAAAGWFAFGFMTDDPLE